MGLGAQKAFHRVGVVCHLLIVANGLQGLFGEGEELRPDEGRLRHRLDILAVDAHVERLGVLRAGVFGAAQVRVAEEVREEQVELRVGFETGPDRGGVGEPALKGSHFGDTRIQLREVFFKSLIGGIKSREVPAVLLFDLVAFFQLVGHDGFSCLICLCSIILLFRKR